MKIPIITLAKVNIAAMDYKYNFIY